VLLVIASKDGGRFLPQTSLILNPWERSEVILRGRSLSLQGTAVALSYEKTLSLNNHLLLLFQALLVRIESHFRYVPEQRLHLAGGSGRCFHLLGLLGLRLGQDGLFLKVLPHVPAFEVGNQPRHNLK
jgi:hypothetical protein